MELPTGSFKVRGALWALSEKFERKRFAKLRGQVRAIMARRRLCGAETWPEGNNFFAGEKQSPETRADCGSRTAIVEKGSEDLAAAWKARGIFTDYGGLFFEYATDPLCRPARNDGCEILEQAPEHRRCMCRWNTALIRASRRPSNSRNECESDWSSGGNGAFLFLSWKSGAPTETECATRCDGLDATPDAKNVRAIALVMMWFS